MFVGHFYLFFFTSLQSPTAEVGLLICTLSLLILNYLHPAFFRLLAYIVRPSSVLAADASNACPRSPFHQPPAPAVAGSTAYIKKYKVLIQNTKDSYSYYLTSTFLRD